MSVGVPRRGLWPLPGVLATLLACLSVTALFACEQEPESGRVDSRLETHAVLPGAPSERGLAYVEAVAQAHQKADSIESASERAELLEAALELEPPAGDGVAEILELDLAARAAEARLDSQAAKRALELLEPRLETSRSLPLDRACARALITLGDAAARVGDYDLAMGSYARSLDMLSLLLEEAAP